MLKNAVPLCELPAEPDADCAVAWQLDPGPFVDQTAIGLELARTHRAMRMAGFGALVITDYIGERTEFQTHVSGISGMNADGSATASGSASASAAKTEKASLSPDSSSLEPEYQWPAAEIAVNRNELGSRISDKVKKGMTREQAWATELDRSVSRGLRSVALKKLIEDGRKFPLAAACTPFCAYFCGTDIATENKVELAVDVGLYALFFL